MCVSFEIKSSVIIDDHKRAKEPDLFDLVICLGLSNTHPPLNKVRGCRESTQKGDRQPARRVSRKEAKKKMMTIMKNPIILATCALFFSSGAAHISKSKLTPDHYAFHKG